VPVTKAFRLIRWADTNGEPVCPRCGCQVARPQKGCLSRCLDGAETMAAIE
jgi:hypothetical protein